MGFADEMVACMPALRRFAMKLERLNEARADDLVQVTLLHAIEKRHLYQEGSNIKGWLMTVMYSRFVNGVRSSKRTGIAVPLENENGAPNPAWQLQVPAAADDVLELHEVDRALDELTPEMREMLLLAGIEGLRYQEIAARTGVPVGTVRSRLSRARELLRLKSGRLEAAS